MVCGKLTATYRLLWRCRCLQRVTLCSYSESAFITGCLCCGGALQSARTPTDRFPAGTCALRHVNHVSSDQSQECFCTLLSFSFSLLSSSFLYIYLRIIDVVESSTALQRRVVPDSNVVPGRSVGSVARVHEAKLPALTLRLRLIQKCC